MATMPYTVKATINLAAIRHNLKQVKQLAKGSNIMAVIKADAYGHGMIEVAQTLHEADGLAVARLEEALLLRQQGIRQRVLLLGGFIDAQGMVAAAENNIDIVIHSSHGLQALLAAHLAKPINVWLKLDTGMHRLGLSPAEFLQAQQLLRNSNNVAEIIFMTHFSSSEDENSLHTQQQLQSFQCSTDVLNGKTSMANSAAIIQHPQSHGDWVRPGIMLYGANPLPADSPRTQHIDLQAAMTLTAKILAIRTVSKGESTGYNCRWTATKDSLIATVGIGYGDGYPRHAKDGTPVLVNGQRAFIAGRVSMDLITIDISDCTGVQIGDDVMLWGQQLKAEEIASYAETISYELFTSISKRVPRIYINAED